MLAGTQYRVALGVTTVHPDFDFETFSEAGYLWDPAEQKWSSLPGIANTERGLKVVGVYNYVAHPSFEVLSLAYNLKQGAGARFWRPGLAQPYDLLEHVWSGYPLEAFNVGFEFVVWNGYCVPKLGWPPLKFEQLRCCQAKARAWSLPGKLAETGAALKLTQLKDPKGEKLIRKLTVPRNPTKTNPELRYTRVSAPEDFAEFDAYNVQDIVSEGEASLRIPDLTPRELEIWRVSESINQRGMCIDMAGVEDCIAVADQAFERYNAELRLITDGRVVKSSEVAKTLDWLHGLGVHLDNLDEDTVDAELDRKPPHDHCDAVKRVLRIRQRLGFGSVKKLYKLRTMVCSDRRLRDSYAYHGAHTGLWNGQGVQMANLYKAEPPFNKPENVERAFSVMASRSLDYVEGVYNGDALETIANLLRSTVVAAPGHRLIMSDYTAIQAVVTAALAGERWRLEVFRTHGKIYETSAARAFNVPLEELLQHKKIHGVHHPLRDKGKRLELACGFGGWIGATKSRYIRLDELLNDEQIKDAILKWRAASPMLQELWGGQVRYKFSPYEKAELYGLEGAAIKAVLDIGTCYGYRGVRYLVVEDVLYCQPPGDGAPLCYHEPRLEPSRRDWARPWELDLSYMGWKSADEKKGRAGGWCRIPLYGGVLTQNVVAKVSREFQADALVALEHAGYRPVMHTHDEIVAEVPSGFGSVAEYLSIVNRGKPWAVDDDGVPWPIKAPSAEEGHRYGKWE